MSESAIQDVICGIGFPVGGNPTQFLLERSFASAGLDTRFMTFEVVPEKMRDAVAGMKALNFKGGALLPPHASLGPLFMDRLADSSKLSQASNCLVREDHDWVGHDTIGCGFIKALHMIPEWAASHVVILGAGDVGRSIAASLAAEGVADLLILDQDAEAGQGFVTHLNEQLGRETRFLPWNETFNVPERVDLLVQATPIGWRDSQTQLPLQLQNLKPEACVIDVNYHPPETWLVREALSRGVLVVNGIELLVHQLAVSFQKWTGMEADIPSIREAAEEYLEI